MMSLRRMLRTSCISLVVTGLAGCRHRTPVAPVIPPPAPVTVAGAVEPKTPPQLPSEPWPSAPLAKAPVVPPTPAKKKKKPAPAPPANEVASAAAPPPLAAPVAIGALSAEGDSTGQNRQRVVELITANEKRLAGFPADTKDRYRDNLLRVRNFETDAQKALGTGDTDGAMTLATKAKVLLDEVGK